ncbi:hypothetical protein EFR00_27755 [Rhizobium sophoriradicis]|nr:hypothetical protein EFR00_27755 [Rhizobium sophoriradicis]
MPPLRILTQLCAAQARGTPCEQQEALPGPSGGEAHDAQAPWPETSERQALVLIQLAANDRWSLDFVSDQLTYSAGSGF